MLSFRQTREVFWFNRLSRNTRERSLAVDVSDRVNSFSPATVKKCCAQFLIVAVSILIVAPNAAAAVQQQSYTSDRVSDVTNTKHNFAAGVEPTLPPNQTRTVKATSQNEVCVFCHTPHFADTTAKSPLWNRKLSNVTTYTLYSSGSLDAAVGQPDGSSKMCLSCHDGTLAIGAVNVVNATATNISIDHTAGGPILPATTGATNKDSIVVSASPTTNISMGTGGLTSGALTATTDGYTSNLGADLRNDHPIGFKYDSPLATADGELYAPGQLKDNYSKDVVGPRVAGKAVASTSIRKPSAPLEGVNGDQVECGTCHDPHIRSAQNDHNIKFLRLNRFQKAAPSAVGSFSVDTDINCLACHKKHGWATSSHADQLVASAQYNSAAAATREFPSGTQVWEVSCLNCHDNHTADGAKKLLRGGVSAGNAASEETCYQCHGTIGESVLASGQELADLRTLESSISAHTESANEVHDTLKVGGTINGGDSATGSGDQAEAQSNLINANRHVECSDCHNPHRSQNTKVFDPTHTSVTSVAGTWVGLTFTGQGTHVHENNVLHTNIASGALRGVWGVEPVYTLTPWGNNASSFTVLQGDASQAGPPAIVTKEYQVCMKCHSSFANLAGKTHQDMEFQAPVGDQGDIVTNHRSWHPVIDSTARTSSASANTFQQPFGVGVGTQTMYCSDCHTNENSKIFTPNTGPQGPHGASHNVLLAGAWDSTTGTVGTSNHLCFNCHKYEQYVDPGASPVESSGFSCAVAANCKQADGASNTLYSTNLHIAHALKDGVPNPYACGQCHVKITHGWENKALLVDKNTRPADATYYLGNATLAVNNFRTSGNWVRTSSAADDCASSGCHTIP